MVIQLTGNVQYTITLDPSVWIFDDRKIDFSKAFSKIEQDKSDDDELKKKAQFWDREVYQQQINPPVNKSINSFEKKKILEGTFVMPIHHFLENALVYDNAKGAILETTNGEIHITLDELQHSLLLFAQKGKQIQEDGPVHLYFQDGSNQQDPITGINKIVIE
ncbi:hypothetical protein [Pontibacillus litoralis]|uniref:Peptidyl-prolyl cis-trans isomerase n=1 Tax=Pontibacillus litoralis JSM 072002 TaxID=1385512 RepID=A0A0A5GBL3_9BACI|nr:hypothetical protein [Pontibacillus litoralis]KGX88588.1 hypothetical protein N784_07915 [Pontibacillus litoralis JSM 072002]